jgi:hypothetical protein
VKPGDVLRATTFTHVEPQITITLKVGDRKRVAVFLLLGHEARDGNEPLDLVAAMDRLGWMMK